MRVNDTDLLAGALARAYDYADLEALSQAYRAVDAAGNGLDLVQALADAGLAQPLTAKLARVTELVTLLRSDAVYGMIALNNGLVGGRMLNACMEESKRAGCLRPLGALLTERGVIDAAQAGRLDQRTRQVLGEILARERSLAEAVDLTREAGETVELELGMLLGEVAGGLTFLAKPDLEAILRRRERIEQGLAPEDEARQQTEVPLPGRLHAPAVAQETPAAAAAPGESDPIKGYELLDKLGQGAMGAVVRARRRETGEIVALKILKPELAADQEYVQRFTREAKAVARLNHPNIIRAVQTGRSGDYYFFAMEFVEGYTVSEMIKAKGRLPERLAVMVTRCIASGLAHAWQHKIVHRDIKPDNVMFTNDGQVKLTDLGLARNAKQDSTLTITGVVMGSPAYISPEQATGEKNLDTRSDLYSLGAALYHMLAGKVPYEADTPLHVMLRHMNDPVPDVKQVVPGVSEATRRLIQRMMAKKPEDRFQSGAEVEAAAAAIEEALARGQEPAITFEPPGQPAAPAPAAPAAPAPRPPSGKSRRPGASGKSRPGGDKPKTRARGVSRKGKGADKAVGERLRRMAAKRKRRF